MCMKTELFLPVLTPCEWKRNYVLPVLTPCEWKRNYLNLCWHHVNENGTIFPCADTMWMKTELFKTTTRKPTTETTQTTVAAKQRLGNRQLKRPIRQFPQKTTRKSTTETTHTTVSTKNDSEIDNWNDPYDGCRKTTTRKPTTETTHTTLAAKQRLGNRQLKRPIRRLPQNNDSEIDNWNDPYDSCRKATTRKPTTETTHTTVAAKQRLRNRQLKQPIRRLLQNNDSETDNWNDPYDGCRKTTTRKSTTETTHTTVAAKQRLGNRQLKRRLPQNNDSEIDNWNDPYDGWRKTTTRKSTTETTHTTVDAKQRLGNGQLKRPIRRLPKNNDSETDNWNYPYDACRKTTTRKPTTETTHTTVAAKQRLGNRQLKWPIRRLPQSNDSETDNWNDPYDGCRKTTTRKPTTETTHTTVAAKRLGNRQLKRPMRRLPQNNDSEIDNWNDPYDGCRKTTTRKSTTETTVASKQRLGNRQLKRPIWRLTQNNDSEIDNWNDPYHGWRKTTTRKWTTETTHTTVDAKQRLGNRQLKRPIRRFAAKQRLRNRQLKWPIRRLPQSNDSETDNWNDPYDGCRKTTTRKPTTETTHTMVGAKQRLGNRQLKRPIRRLPQNNDPEIDNWNDPYDGCRKTTTRKSTTETTVASKQRLGNRQLKRPIWRLTQNNDSEIDNWNDPYHGWRKTTTRKSTTETTHRRLTQNKDSEIDNWNDPYDGCHRGK